MYYIPNMQYTQTAKKSDVEETKTALEANGFNVLVVKTSAHAVRAINELIPEGTEVIDNTSKTLDDTGIRALLHSDKYVSVNKKTLSMDRQKDGRRINEMRSVGDYAIGSVHAITKDGKILIASGSGSQLPGYVYGASNVVLVAGTNKIVKDLDAGFDRIYNHSLPLESVRVQKAYGMDHANVRKILIFNSEGSAGRTTILLIEESHGY